jgi:lipopolysaccharide/colanic/teichoic acid biosynthesis glycosyltransferase
MEEHIPYYALRMSVRPGVTGWAQVKYGYAMNQEDVTEKIRYDLYYIKHRSLWLDIIILFDTIKLVAFGRESLVGRSLATQPSYRRAGETERLST